MQSLEKKGKKRVKGVPIHEDSVKKRHGIFLTDTTWLKMQTIAKEQGLSVGQLVEKTFREMEAPEI